MEIALIILSLTTLIFGSLALYYRSEAANAQSMYDAMCIVSQNLLKHVDYKSANNQTISNSTKG